MPKPPPISPLEQHLGYWLRFVSNHVSHAFKLKVESLGVTVAEWVVLRALFDSEGVNPSHLAQTIGLTRGAVSKLIDRLVEKGLLTCTSEKSDRRFQIIRLTPKGRKRVPQLAALADQNDREFFGHLAPNQRDLITNMLKNIVQQQGLKQLPVN
jgi:DNA-binding MarR family transcriptional regulator